MKKSKTRKFLLLIPIILIAVYLIFTCVKPGEYREFSFKTDRGLVEYRIRVFSPIRIAYLKYEECSEGRELVGGDEDKFYTDEEKAEREAARDTRKQQNEELFSKMEGLWETDTGEFFKFSRGDESYEVYVDFEDTESSYDMLSFNLRGNELFVSYPAGAMDGSFNLTMSEDWNSFTYGDNEFTKKG